MVFKKKFSVAFNFSSSVLLCSCSRTLFFFTIGVREVNGSM